MNKCTIFFVDHSFRGMNHNLSIYQIQPGSREDTFALANRVFNAMDTTIGEDIIYYDDCVVIYNEEHNVSFWYYYATATYEVKSSFRLSLNDSEARDVSSNEVEKALQDLMIEIPADANFDYIGEGEFSFSVEMSETDSGVLDGTITCLYYEGKAYQVKHEVLNLSHVGTTEKMSQDELCRNILKGNFYVVDESLSMIGSKIDSIIIEDINIVYIIDSKNFYYPVYMITASINNRIVAFCIRV